MGHFEIRRRTYHSSFDSKWGFAPSTIIKDNGIKRLAKDNCRRAAQPNCLRLLGQSDRGRSSLPQPFNCRQSMPPEPTIALSSQASKRSIVIFSLYNKRRDRS